MLEPVAGSVRVSLDEGGAAQLCLVDAAGHKTPVDDLNVPSAVKGVLKQLDFGREGSLSEEQLQKASELIEAMKLGLDTDSSGSVSVEEMLKGIELLADLKKAAKENSGEMSYLHLPEKIREVMAEWDVDGTGKLSHHELAAAAKAHQQVKQEGRMMKKIIFGMAIFIAFLMVSMFVLCYLAAEAAKEMRGSSSGVMHTTSGEVVKLASSEYMIDSSGRIVPRDPSPGVGSNSSRRLQGSNGVTQPITTSMAHTTYGLSSTMSNNQLKELTSFTLELASGDARLIKVDSWKRVSQPGAHHCGMVLLLHTSAGNFTLDDTDIYYEGHDAEILAQYGAGNADVIAAAKDDPDDIGQSRRLAESSGREPIRRLSEAGRTGKIRGRRLSAAALAGMYNSIANAAEQFSCFLTDDSGAQINIEPPKPPISPYSYVAEYEYTCEVGANSENICFSKLDSMAGSTRPGANVLSDGTTTMRAYQSVLMFDTVSVMISYFASHPLQRKVEVWDYTNRLKRSFTLFGLTIDGNQQLHCSLANMTQEEVDMRSTPKPIDLSFLGAATDGDTTQYNRWNIADKDAVRKPGEPPSSIEFWENQVTKAPYRMFMPGPTQLAPNVNAAIFFAPMRVQNFQQNLSADQTLQWLNTRVGQSDSNAMTLVGKLVDSCNDVETVIVANSMPEKVPAISGAYGEDAATWYADRMNEMDSQTVDRYLKGPGDMNAFFQWPDSVRAYWAKLKSIRSNLLMQKMMLQAMQDSSQCAAGQNLSQTSGRRMGATMTTLTFPTFIAEALLGPGGSLTLGAGSGCLMGQVVKGVSRPKWADQAGLDISVKVNLQYCWSPAFSLQGAIALGITKGYCLDLPWTVPRYNMAAFFVKGDFIIQGQSPAVSNCKVVSDGYLKGQIGFQASIGIYNNDDSGRPCTCGFCNPADWGDLPDTTQINCGCERTVPGGDRRRSFRHDYDFDMGVMGVNGWVEPPQTRRRRGGATCPQCYKNPPVFDIGAAIKADFSVKFSPFTPGSAVNVAGTFGLSAQITILGFNFQKTIVEDMVLFNVNNAFQLKGSICRRRLDPVTNDVVEEEVFDDMEGGLYICEDTCVHANDGHCDDGGDGSKFALCGLGTDCNDCGTRLAP